MPPLQHALAPSLPSATVHRVLFAALLLFLTPLAAHAQSGQGNPNGGSNNPEQSAPVVLTVSVAPDRVPITSGTATLTWSGQNARYCSVDGVSRAASGSTTVGPWTTAGAKSILVECWNNGKAGYAANTVTVTVYNVAKPVITTTLSKSLLEAGKDTFVVTYSATNAKSCMLAGTKYPTSGSATLGPYPAGKHSLTFSCSGDGGSTSHTINWEAINAVTLSASVSPATVKANGADTVRVSWTGSNADSCKLDGATAAKSGSKTFGPYSYSQTGTKSATVSCTNRLGSASDTATWKVNAPPPTVSVTLSKSRVTAGEDTVNLSWTSSNSDSCRYDGRTRGASGTVRGLGPFTAGEHTFSVSCTGTGGTTSDTATLTAEKAPDPPTVTVSLNPETITASAGTSTLSWSSTGATSCSRDGKTAATRGSASVGPYSQGSYDFTVSCTGPGGSGSDTVTLTVEPPPDPPTVTVSLNPNRIPINTGTSTLTWSSRNATSCSRDGTVVATSGSATLGPYSTAGEYATTVSCTGDGGSASDSVTIIVDPPPPEPPEVKASLSPTTIAADSGTSELSWTSTGAASCTRDGDPASLSGSVTVGPFDKGTYRFTVRCTGPGGTDRDTVRLIVVPLPTVSVNLSATTITADKDKVNLTWTSTDAKSCEYGSISLPTSGTRAAGPFTEGEHDLTVSCNSVVGTDSETVKLTAVALPTITAGFNPTTVVSHTGKSTLSWQSTGATACWLNGGTPLQTSGSMPGFGPFHEGSHEVTVTCENSLGAEVEKTATVTAQANSTADETPATPENLDVTPNPSIDGNIKLTWNAPSSGAAATGYLVYAKDSITGPFSKNFAERSLALSGLAPGWHFFEVFACAGSESSPNCGSSASTSVRVLVTVEQPDLTGFDQNYRIWGKAGTNDFFVAREEGLYGNPGVTGFYMLEDKAADATTFYKFMYPVTHESAKADGFTTQPNLSLELIDANLDRNMDLIVKGLENKTLGRWDMLIFSGAETGSFPADRVEIDAGFKKFFSEINEWYKSCDKTFRNCSYFFDNARTVSVPKVIKFFKAEKGFATAAAASAKLSQIRTGTHYSDHDCNHSFGRCFVVEADANPVTNDIATEQEVSYVLSPSRFKLRTIRDFDDDPDLPNLFFIFGLIFNPLDMESTKDFSGFSKAFEASYSLSKFLQEGELQIESIEAAYLRLYLAELFGLLDVLTMPLPSFEADARAEIRFDFLMGVIRRFAEDVDQPEDIVGNPELDAFVLENVKDLVPFLRAGYSERVFTVDAVDGKYTKVRERIGSNDHESTALFIRGTSVAVVHTHPHSPVGINPPNPNDPSLSNSDKNWAAEAQSNMVKMLTVNEDNWYSDLENECRELPGMQDHVAVDAFDVPNYILTPSGAVRVFERIDGKFKVRSVSGMDYGAKTMNSSSYQVFDTNGNTMSHNLPSQEGFVAGISAPCNLPPQEAP